MSSETSPARCHNGGGGGGGSSSGSSAAAVSGAWVKQLKRPGALTRRLRERLKSKHPEWDWRRQKLAQHDTDPGGGGNGGGGGGGSSGLQGESTNNTRSISYMGQRGDFD